MVDLNFNEATKEVEFDQESLSHLSNADKLQAEQTSALINRLMKDLVNQKEDIPDRQSVQSKTVSISASKLQKSGVDALTSNKPADAAKLLQTALDTILRRTLWEPTVQLFEEVSLCLGPLCDANIALKNWEDAYTNVSILLLIKPLDASNHFRKGVIMDSAGRPAEAKEFFRTATVMAPENKAFKAALAKAEEQ